jgi:hypothetical protein
MRGAAASSAAHRGHASGSKHHPKSNTENLIEASDDLGPFLSGEPNGTGKGGEKEVDPEYDEEQDHLYVFPPPRYRKGDSALGILMSG